MLVSGGFDKIVGVWNMKERILLKIFKLHKHYICSVQIESTGEFFYTSGRDNVIYEWNTKTLSKSASFAKFYSNICQNSFTLTPNEKYIAAADFKQNHVVLIFNILSKEIFCIFDDYSKTKENKVGAIMDLCSR